MGDASQIPNDENGDVLRRMLRDGDDLSKPRMIDFCYIFPERRQALAFAEMVDDRELEVCISYNEERGMWDAVVKRYMLPTHQDITAFELSLHPKRSLSAAKQMAGVALFKRTNDND
jgi:hypothetical protein